MIWRNGVEKKSGDRHDDWLHTDRPIERDSPYVVCDGKRSDTWST